MCVHPKKSKIYSYTQQLKNGNLYFALKNPKFAISVLQPKFMFYLRTSVFTYLCKKYSAAILQF